MNVLRLPTHACFCLLVCLSCAAESEDAQNEGESVEQGLTYHRDAKPILDARCGTCHQDGDIGPFSLTTYEEVMTFETAVRASIENGTMPPWKPDDACNTYVGNIDLSAEERDIVLRWLDAGGLEGDPADAPATDTPETVGFEADLSLALPEAYTPTLEPDDYRCQLIEWPAQETRYVTGLQVTPDQKSIVHHTIVFVVGPDQVEQFQAYDEAEPGPGYTCYGGPTASDQEGGGGLGDIDLAEVLAFLERLGLTLEDLQSGNVTEDQLVELLEALDVGGAGAFNSIGSWVPGVPNAPFPAGTGIRVEPGSMLAVQMHYNTLSSAPVADQSTIEIATTDHVEREATTLPLLDIGWVTNGLLGEPMTIPAGESSVEHAVEAGFDSLFMGMARNTLGLADDAPLTIHNANHHMHELGVTHRTEVRHDDGSTTCVLDIPEWDFAWQGAYTLEQPITLRRGDSLWMGCSWDNSAANQPVIDGEVKEPADVTWGEGTSDEMCLGAYYVTAAE